MGHVQLVRDTWDALSRGDRAPLEAALAPDARWRAVEDGPWNCEGRAAILDVMTRNLAGGLSGRLEEVLPVADRVVVAFRPDHHDPGGWPLDDGIRYMVITVAGGRVTEMKGCADRKTALAYAGATSEPVMQSSVPVIDLTPWASGDETARAAVAARVDEALRSVGFFLITGHGVPAELRARVRAVARDFFALPPEAKQRYAVTVGGRGWLPPGVEANGYAEGTLTPPDLKESFTVGADQPTGDPEVDGFWFQPNAYPAEVPALEPAVVAYLARMRELADELLVLCAAALDLESDFFTRHTGHATHTMNINWYPPMRLAGEPEPGQFRIGPHTDFGTVTILDREPGRGGLQVWTERGGWQDAPYAPGAFTINTGDLLARWSGDRWKSNRHRVLPPQAEAPDEDLVSLVYFYEADHDAVIESLQPPIGKPNDYAPVVAAQFLKERLDAITVG